MAEDPSSETFLAVAAARQDVPLAICLTALTFTLGEVARWSCGAGSAASEELQVAFMTIGEFARRSRLSPKALRLYDELGLLVPVRVDDSSG